MRLSKIWACQIGQGIPSSVKAATNNIPMNIDANLHLYINTLINVEYAPAIVTHFKNVSFTTKKCSRNCSLPGIRKHLYKSNGKCAPEALLPLMKKPANIRDLSGRHCQAAFIYHMSTDSSSFSRVKVPNNPSGKQLLNIKVIQKLK